MSTFSQQSPLACAVPHDNLKSGFLMTSKVSFNALQDYFSFCSEMS